MYNDGTKGMEAISENFENNMVAHKLRRNISSGSLFVYIYKKFGNKSVIQKSWHPLFITPPPPPPIKKPFNTAQEL